MVDESERAPSPEETLRLIAEQQAMTIKRLWGDPLLMFVPWGVAWLLGFTCYFLHYGLSGKSYVPISADQALAVLMITQVVAGALTAYEITRTNSGVRGESSARNLMYSCTWTAGFVLIVVLCVRLSPMLPPQEAGLLWAGASLLVVGLLYMAGGTIWLWRPMFFMGTAVVAVDAVGVALGPGWHALLAAVLLGGGQIVAGLLLRRLA
jgi:hypothetical protein